MWFMVALAILKENVVSMSPNDLQSPKVASIKRPVEMSLRDLYCGVSEACSIGILGQ